MSDEERLERIGEILAEAVSIKLAEEQRSEPAIKGSETVLPVDQPSSQPMTSEEKFTLEYRVLKFVEKFKQVPISAVMDEFEISRSRAYRVLHKHCEAGRIVRKGNTRGRIYSATA